MLAPLGMPIEAIGEQAGDAATRKLLRSVVIKGLAALLIEAMHAADAAGFADETWQNLVDQFTAADGTFLRRMVEGTGSHAVRRLHEMEAAAELLTDLGVDPVMTRSTVENLRRVPTDGLPPPAPTSDRARRSHWRRASITETRWSCIAVAAASSSWATTAATIDACCSTDSAERPGIDASWYWWWALRLRRLSTRLSATV